ncbi:hypothetical protein [Paraliomyxa miuraensis]|uniref:hypothetical protein n=1 Tax=Paraliomyxa miuraensis TaxID=376150 RepID=UPI002258370D|nr:hypothetical protein [Paraliomyxa miuraensis]MCX4242562.1 hypothetical protein [Paraliomyxa miuraensis]
MTRRTRRRLAPLGLTLALSSAGPVVLAAEPTGDVVIADAVTTNPAPNSPTAVYVVAPAGTDPGLLEVLAAARANLQAQGVELQQVEPAPGQTAANRARALVSGGLARGAFWLDERSPGEIRVFMLDAQGTAYVRRVPVEPASIEASREAVWHIVEAGSLALATGEPVSMEQAKTEDLEPSPKPEPEPPPPAEPVVHEPPPPELVYVEPSRPYPPFRIGCGLAYLGSGLAREIPWSSGAVLDVKMHAKRAYVLSASYGLLLPGRRGEPVVTWRHRAELRAGPRLLYTRNRVELHVLAGGAMEALRWQATSSDDAGWRATALATIDGSVAVRIKANLWLVIEPGAEVLLNRFAFVECEAGAPSCEGATRRVVLDPWRVRPRARAGLTVQF